MAITELRALKRLRNYRSGVQVIYSSLDRTCYVTINKNVLVSTSSWEEACQLAIEAWLAEDAARKFNPKAYVLYGKGHHNRCQVCLPGLREGVHVAYGLGKTWSDAITNFRVACDSKYVFTSP